MPTYVCKSVSPQGTIVKSKVDDDNELSVVKMLKQNGYRPISIKAQREVTIGNINRKPKAKRNSIAHDSLTTAKITKKQELNKTFAQRVDHVLMSTERITSRDIRIFTQNFYLLKKANFNNIHALSTVIRSTENVSLRNILEDILSGVESGEFMYTTMEYYSNVFPFIYINMIKVGELSGSLEKALEQAVKYLDETDALSRKLKRILIPNIAMFVAIMIMLFGAVIIGVPILQDIFAEIGTEDQLPAVTLWFAGIVDNLMLYWYIPVGIIGAIVAAIVFYVHTPKGRYNFDYLKYRMPVFGDLIYALDFTRLARNMLLNLDNGMRIQEALEISKNVVKNKVMLSMIETSINNIFVGESWIDPFEYQKFSNKMATEMLRIGMQTDLPEMMAKLVMYMDIDIENKLERIMKVLPELSAGIVGALLIFFVVVVLIPCIQVYMGGWLFSAYGF